MAPKIDGRIPDLVTLSEAAELLGMTRQNALLLVQNGRLPARKVGSAGWVVRRVVVERRMAS